MIEFSVLYIFFSYICFTVFAPLSNVYHFFSQVNLQICVCYAQMNYFTLFKFSVCWLILLDKSCYAVVYNAIASDIYHIVVKLMSDRLSCNILSQLTLLRYGAA